MAFEAAISCRFFYGFETDILHNEAMASPLIQNNSGDGWNDFSFIGPGREQTPVPVAPQIVVLQEPIIIQAPTPPPIIIREIIMAPPPAKKKKKFDYAEDLKKKTKEELEEFFNEQIKAVDNGFSCAFGDCKFKAAMKTAKNKDQHVKDHVSDVLELYKCQTCAKVFTRAGKLALHKCKAQE